MSPARAGRAAVAALAAGAAWSCGPAEPLDALSERCLAVLRFREPALAEVLRLDVDVTSRRSGERALRAAGRRKSDGERIEREIACTFAGSGPWTLAHIAIDGRSFTEAEVTLVNSELLLRDLSENPERLGQARPTAPTPEAGEPVGDETLPSAP